MAEDGTQNKHSDALSADEIRALVAELIAQSGHIGTLSANDIRPLVSEGLIEPFEDLNVSGAKYGARVGAAYWQNGEIKTLDATGIIEIPPMSLVVIETLERFRMPLNVVAHTLNRRKFAIRLSLLADSGGQIDPGWQGHLQSIIQNVSGESVRLSYGENFLDVEFAYLASPAPAYRGLGMNLTLSQAMAQVGHKIVDGAFLLRRDVGKLQTEYSGLAGELQTTYNKLADELRHEMRETERRQFNWVIRAMAVNIMGLALMVAILFIAFIILNPGLLP